MDNFIVSARKYRPATFNAVVGQESITTTLKNAIKNNHLAQAYLFCGPRGVGKTTCARILAKTINCQDITESIEACNKCESCLSFNDLRSFNIHELDAASNNSVEDIRNLTDQVRILPQVGKYSIYIIDEVHMLSASAFNAFLKTLEEPPSHAIFILATTQKQKIIPTILSRCQIFDFNRIKVIDIKNRLKFVAENEDVKFEVDALDIIAQKADGAMRDALFIFDQIVSYSGEEITYKNVIENLNILDYEYYFKITDAFLRGNISEALLLFNTILENGFDGHNFITGLSEHFRDLLVCKDEITIQLLEVGDSIKQRYNEQTSKCGADFIFRALEITNNCDVNYRQSRNQRLFVELCLIRLCRICSSSKDSNIPSEEKKNDKKSSEDILESAETKKNINISSKLEKNINIKPPENIFRNSTPSIKGVIKPESTKKVKSGEEEIHPDEDEFSSTKALQNDFNQEELQNYWLEFADTIKDKELRLYNTFTSQKPLLKDEFIIEFNINNPLQKEAIKGIKGELLTFLKDKLHNQKIQLEIILPEQESNNKPYTSEDKFDEMIKKNPELDDLKQKFYLDFE